MAHGELRQARAALAVTSSWLFWALLAAAFAALTAIFGKLGVAQINADYATLLRTLVVVVVLAAIVAATGQAQPLTDIAGRTYLFLVLSGVATGLSWLCYYRALKLGPASLVAPVDKLSVVLVAIFGVALLGERLDLRQWCGIAAIGGGVLLLAWRP
ncbi:MAG: EamA family transporter [Pseudomonas oryzihabitans]